MISMLFIVWLGNPLQADVVTPIFDNIPNPEEIVAIINKPDALIITECLYCENTLQPFTTIHAPELNNVRSGATDTNYKMHFKCTE